MRINGKEVDSIALGLVVSVAASIAITALLVSIFGLGPGYGAYGSF